MKKLIVVVLLYFLCALSLGAQHLWGDEPNVLYLSLEPLNSGVGVRYDRMINTRYGAYGALSLGDYKMDNSLVKRNFRLLSGVLLYPQSRNRHDNFKPYFGVGVCYNMYFGLYECPPNLPENALNQWSFELGAHAKIMNQFNIGIRVDPMKKHGSLDLGISF